MTPEQLENTMQFIVEQQAELTAITQKNAEAIAALEKNSARHNQEIQTVTDLVGRLAVAMTQLAEAQKKSEMRLDAFDDRMNALAEAQKDGDERLNAFITFVEKYLIARNGGGKAGT